MTTKSAVAGSSRNKEAGSSWEAEYVTNPLNPASFMVTEREATVEPSSASIGTLTANVELSYPMEVSLLSRTTTTSVTLLLQCMPSLAAIISLY